MFNHPKRAKVKLHRLIAARALGRKLKPTEHVHHHSQTQLVICEGQAYHSLLEVRTRVFRAGGNPDTDALCGHCNETKSREQFRRAGKKAVWECRECRNKIDRAVPAHERKAKREALIQAYVNRVY